MHRIVSILLLSSCLTGAAQAQDVASPSDRAAIQQVISAQIEAFRHEDGDAAFGLAAPNIKARFGDAPTFLEGVREAYPAVFHPRSFAFGALSAENRFLIQHVELIGPDGRDALALYSMEHEPDGTWRIAGCSLVGHQHLEI